MATCYRTKGKGDNLQGTKQNVPDKLHFEQKYRVYSRIRNRIMPVGWHMKKTREMANYFTSSDPNHGISRDIFWHTVWFMFQFPLLQMHRLIKLKTLTSMKLQAGGRSHFWSGARWSEIRGHIRAVIPKLPARSKVTADLLLPWHPQLTAMVSV